MPEKDTHVFTLRMTEDEWQLIVASADLTRQSVNGWLLSAIDNRLYLLAELASMTTEEYRVFLQAHPAHDAS